MAERIIRQLIDDVDGSEIPDGRGERVEFSVRGVTYRMDLSAANVAKFDKALKPFIDAAAKVGGGDSRPAKAATNGTKAATNGTKAATNGTKAATNGTKAATNGKTSKEQKAAIRAWGRKNGHRVSDRGRIKDELLEAFVAAH
jgi:hypothetical protein